MTEALNHAQWSTRVNMDFLARVSMKASSPSVEQVFAVNDQEEELLHPCSIYELSRAEIERLKSFYEANVGIRPNGIDSTAVRYARLLTSHGDTIGSGFLNSNRNPDHARANNGVRIRLDVDKLAHRPTAPPIFESRWFVGEVNYFLAHSFQNRVYLLAYVQVHTSSALDDMNQERVSKARVSEFIDVRQIDRPVGFAKIGSSLYVLDVETVMKVPKK
jgi:hypothetical protein